MWEHKHIEAINGANQCFMETIKTDDSYISLSKALTFYPPLCLEMESEKKKKKKHSSINTSNATPPLTIVAKLLRGGSNTSLHLWQSVNRNRWFWTLQREDLL